MVQAVRGMRDILPVDVRRWRRVEGAIHNSMAEFAYEELHLPLLEYTELFARGVGEATDIVEKEMFNVENRDGESLSLRPEGTASCVRALQENGLLYNQTQKVCYAGPMFRYEKPQKGRYRQFYQVGAEAFGFAGPDVDAELIALSATIWRQLGILEHVRLEINTLGDADARRNHRQALVDYLTPLADQLDEDSQRRLQTNPLRILDSKFPQTQALLEQAPRLPDYVDEQSAAHFAELLTILDAMGIAYVHNTNLVRGLDYYTHTVFEWITDDLGAQGTICGGGRYDGLVERLGGKPMPAAGFAIGVDRAVLLHEFVQQDNVGRAVDVYVCTLLGGADSQSDKEVDIAASAAIDGLRVAAQLRQSDRNSNKQLRVRLHNGGGNLKKQLKKANASGAQWAIIVARDTFAAGTVSVKNLNTGEQHELSLADTARLIADG